MIQNQRHPLHPAGVEPTTYGFGGRHSIQLSYGCFEEGRILRDLAGNIKRKTVRRETLGQRNKERSPFAEPRCRSKRSRSGEEMQKMSTGKA